MIKLKKKRLKDWNQYFFFFYYFKIKKKKKKKKKKIKIKKNIKKYRK